MTDVHVRRARDAAHLLARGGFERVLDLPVEPSRPGVPRRPVTAIEVDGNWWSVRAFASDFRLVQPSWRGRGVPKVYSLGWGLTPVGQTPCLVLIEAVGDEVDRMCSEADALVRELSEAGFVTRVVVRGVHSGTVMQVAAYPADTTATTR